VKQIAKDRLIYYAKLLEMLAMEVVQCYEKLGTMGS
jgi:hypothetical protein